MGSLLALAALVAVSRAEAVQQAVEPALERSGAAPGARSARARLLQAARIHNVPIGRLLSPVFLELAEAPPGQNFAYYAGNYSPAKPWSPNNRQSGGYNKNNYWGDNVYWKYFKEAWGDAPFADANFRLWLQGFFKNYDLPREAKKYQTTKSLPAWMHYYNARYDPTLDPPYESDFALFGGKKSPGSVGEGSDVLEDCSQGDSQRPCGVADKEKWTKSKSKQTLMDPSLPYVKIDRYWAKREGEEIPANVPPPPPAPPSFASGDSKPPSFSIGPAAGNGESSGSGS